VNHAQANSPGAQRGGRAVNGKAGGSVAAKGSPLEPLHLTPVTSLPQRAAKPPKVGPDLDRWMHAQLSRFSGGISIPALRMAFEDWAVHLSHNPAEQMALARDALGAWQRWLAFLAESAAPGGKSCIEPMVHDKRFAAEAWQHWPFNVMSQSFLVTEQWWDHATRGVRGVSRHHEEVVNFSVRQMLDLFSPANFVLSNPEILNRTLASGGVNLAQGFGNWLDDLQRQLSRKPPAGAESFQPGVNVAVTPGQVIYRNHLIELIQYAPATPRAKVHPEPVLVVPSWIMKYYILDLSPHNSLIMYLVEQGYTVFAISWRNPEAGDRNLGMDDYLQLGVMDALDAVQRIVPGQRIHAAGYCLGGTLLAIAAAAMARDGGKRLATLSLFAGQTDFTEPGELDLFIDESQVTLLEDVMWDKGYLDNQQMSGSFQLLNSNDLVWSRVLKDYLLGERSPLSDLMAWNADGTRLPYRMHSEYLRQLFLGNDLAFGRYKVGGQAIALSDIQCPIYCVGTQRDHVAPWRSVYKLHLLTHTELCFTLTSGGHNVGIVNPPGVPGRSYQSLTRGADKSSRPYLDAESWLQAAPQFEGSWWTHWAAWLRERSGPPVTAPGMGAPQAGLAPLCEAPGHYVMQK